MRPIKELMQIMLDHVGEINEDWPTGLCQLTTHLSHSLVIEFDEMAAIDEFLFDYIEPIRIERNSFYAFDRGLVEPRRELLIKIINDLP